MATQVGGHTVVTDEHLPLNYYDECPSGPRGAGGAEGDLLRCSCGRRVELLHFAGGVRAMPLLRQLNETLLRMDGRAVRELATLRAARPRWAHGSRS